MLTNDTIDYSNADIRRDIIRRLYYALKSPNEIIVVLDRRGALDGLDYSEKVRLVKNELNAIKQADRSALSAVRADADGAWADYVSRQMFLYGLAVENRDIPNAMQLSKDIARAHGIRTDAPIVVEHDLGKILREASLARNRPAKAVQEPKKAIDLLPKDYVLKPEPSH